MKTKLLSGIREDIGTVRKEYGVRITENMREMEGRCNRHRINLVVTIDRLKKNHSDLSYIIYQNICSEDLIGVR